ncbi:MAG: alpha/beta fold hydrolase, partial [Cyanobacteria bacterium P01_A01_bin.114]
MDTQKTAIAQRSQQKLYFEHRDMDYYLSWILGRQIYGGSEPETCFKAASHIVEGDPDSWQQAWAKQAQQIEARAETALGQGDFDSAKERYLQACTYYRAPLFIMSPKAATFWEYWHKMQVCFQTAAALFDPPVEAIQVPFQGNLLPGYLWPAARIGEHRGQQRPTLIIIGGLETFAEDGYFMVGQTSSERGYCAIAVDLPGQGMTPNNDLFFEARMGAAVKAVVDYALTRPEVDPDQLALFGFSWGGHIVFKGAEYDQRIKALIATPAMPDVFRAALAQQGQHGRGDRVGKAVFDQIAWRFGLKLSLKP